MKKSTITLLVALSVSPFLCQCASQDELNQINYQIRMLNKRVDTLETTTIDNLQKRQAAQANQTDQLYQEFLTLKSGLEETGHVSRRLTEQSKELESAFQHYTKEEEEKRTAELQRLEEQLKEKDQHLANLSEQLKIQQEHLESIQQARVQEAKRKAAAAARVAAAARAKAEALNKPASSIITIHPDKEKKKISESVASTPTHAETSTKEISSSAPAKETPPVSATTATEGNRLFQSGKFREAYKAFESVAQNKKGSMAAIDARYMMGECLFQLKEYDQAILEYQNIITNSPSSAKAPLAMLKQGLAFERLDDKATAKVLYQKILASYKNSPEAEKAQERLNKL